MKIKLPVSYEVFGIVEVEADNIEDAINYFNENCNEIELPDHPEYVDGSFQLSGDDVDYIKLFNK